MNILKSANNIAASLPKVTYTLEVQDGPDAFWQVRRIHLTEALSEPYTLILDLVTEHLDADTDALLGASFDLQIARDVLFRSICGIIHQVEYIGVKHDRLQVRVIAGPALYLLGQRVDTRLWQDSTVPEVIEEVLAALGDYARVAKIDALTSTYAPREYIVQYRESDLDFVHRLMEEEGITYWFDQVGGEGKEVMVLEDSNDDWADVETIDDDPGLRIIIDRADNAEVESIQEFGWSRELTSTSVDQRIFDWLIPASPGQAYAPAKGEGGDERGRVREVYHHGHLVEPDPQPRTLRKLMHLRQRDSLARGLSMVTGLAPGRKFSIVEHARTDLEREYLVRRVVHAGDCPDVVPGETPTDLPRYQNRFECMVFDPSDPYRPPNTTSRPRIFGPQTAIVTGPDGEEIHTDEHGRVKVLFSWDRVNRAGGDTSMWIRVAHHWAGPGFGTFFVPRIGMEVVVEFIEGDPAKPLINGCVYNGINQVSVGPAENKTQSTIRTRSSPNSEGYNEILFEDAAGSEKLVLHAQKDFDETVENNHSTTVHNDQTIAVDANQTATVGGNQTISVTGNQNTSVTGNQSISVTGSQSESITGEATLSVQQNRTVAVTGKRSTTVQGGEDSLNVTGDYKLDASSTICVQAPSSISLSCGGACISLSPSTITLTVAELSITIDGDAKTITLATPATMVELADAHAKIYAGPGAGLELLDNVVLASAEGKSGLCLSDKALLGSKVEAVITAPIAVLVSGDNSVAADASGVAVAGMKVDVMASGVATLCGALVKIN
ncbi:type VI secretion system Vgr family protein [Nannocystaceae bacterium ST9]